MVDDGKDRITFNLITGLLIMFRKIATTLLSEKLGLPTRSTKYVSAWRINELIDVVLETLYENKSNCSYTYAWLPTSCKDVIESLIATTYAIGKGRHSNTYASNGLEKGKSALKIKLTDTSQVKLLIERLAAKQKAVS